MVQRASPCVTCPTVPRRRQAESPFTVRTSLLIEKCDHRDRPKLVKALSSTTSWFLAIKSWSDLLCRLLLQPKSGANFWLLPYDDDLTVHILDKRGLWKRKDFFWTFLVYYWHAKPQKDSFCRKKQLILQASETEKLSRKPQWQAASSFLTFFFFFAFRLPT